ncbi:TonB-dependent receptor [Niveispirillum sp.]|uniref:TonB-dependent receptor n=1 Tax=Niveispirillum sp. TaxID=1917217 RepID=UPI001B76AC64|nr:TonB-dependent receptor [Niveispirillum sp.]MBP7334347.1 TonB-dependent receptor [Niveispirillum sp.]
MRTAIFCTRSAFRRSTAIALPMMLGALAAPAAAQSAPASSGAILLEEIIVTAQKRSENLQDVPISVTAVTADMLDTAGTYNVLDLEKISPGLQVYQTGASVLPFIRGIGSNQSNPGFESPVAVYLDGIYQANKGGNSFDLANIERIEVLKGPQGTLFGRNATGGAINIITKDPGERPRIEAEIGYGKFNEKRARAYADGQVTDTLSASVAFTGRWDDGYIDNIFLDKKANPSENMVGMGKLVLKPNDNFTARLSGSYYYHDSATFLSPHVKAGTLPTAAGAGYAPIYGLYDTSTAHDTGVTNKGYRGTLNMDYDFSDMRLVSYTGYVKGSSRTLSSSDISEATIGYSGSRNQPGEQFSQEFQLQSTGNDKVNWIGGLYYMWFKEGFDNLISASNVPSPIRPIDLTRPGAGVVAFNSFITTEAYAAFAEANARLTDDLRVTAGLRYSSEEKGAKGEMFRFAAVPYAGSPGEDFYNTVLGPASDNLAFGKTPLAAMDLSKNFDKLTWRLALDYTISDDVMAYASYNRGFKSGTYNPSVVSPAQIPVSPEILDAYEVGLKTELLDRRVRLNSSAFYYDYSNIQVGLISAAGVTTVQNAAAARVYGLDVDLTALLSDQLTLRGAVNLLDSKYKNYASAQVFLPRTTAACSAPPPAITYAQAQTLAAATKLPGSCSYALNATGQDLIFAPKISANIALDYDVPMGDARMVLTGALYYNGGYDIVPGGLFGHIPAYESLSLSATYHAPGDRYFVRLWGDNLTDSNHAIYISPQALGIQEVNARPLSFGVTVGFKFGD